MDPDARDPLAKEPPNARHGAPGPHTGDEMRGLEAQLLQLIQDLGAGRSVVRLDVVAVRELMRQEDVRLPDREVVGRADAAEKAALVMGDGRDARAQALSSRTRSWLIQSGM